VNPTLEHLSAHRTIRKFTAEPVAEEDVRQAVAAAQMASTSSNIQAYSLLRIRDAQTRARLVTLTGGQPQVAQGAFFVVCGDTRRHRLAARQHGEEYVCNLEAVLLMVTDAALFAQNLALAFESLGLGICFIGGLRNQLPDVDHLLELPEGVLPLFGLCVGHPDDDPSPRPRLELDAVLIEERYPEDATVLAKLAGYDERMRQYYAERGNPGHDWTSGIVRKFREPKREHLFEFFRAKGVTWG